MGNQVLSITDLTIPMLNRGIYSYLKCLTSFVLRDFSF